MPEQLLDCNQACSSSKDFSRCCVTQIMKANVVQAQFLHRLWCGVKDSLLIEHRFTSRLLRAGGLIRTSMRLSVVAGLDQQIRSCSFRPAFGMIIRQRSLRSS